VERYTLWRPEFGPERKHLFLEYFFIFGEAAKLRWAGARPVWRVNEPKKTGARSARARTRGQNPLVSRNSSLKLAEEARDDFSNQKFTTTGSSTNSRRQIDDFSSRKRQEA
jgi:hypothetical protein